MGWLAPALAAAVLIGACAVEPSYPIYSPLEVAGGFGYAEQRLADRIYQVRYSAPIQWTRAYGRAARRHLADVQVALAYDLALRRAAEVSLANGFPSFDVTARENDVQFDVIADYFYDPFFGRGRFRHYRVTDLDYFAELAVRVSLTVRLTARPSDQGFDAARTLARLRAKYPDATGRPRPGG